MQSYPSLAGEELLAGDLGQNSVVDQAAAGLTFLGEEEQEAFTEVTQAYREKFGFPLIIAVRELSSEQVLEQAWHRLDNSPTQEHAAALLEIAKIANHRLEDVVEDTTPLGFHPRGQPAAGALAEPVSGSRRDSTAPTPTRCGRGCCGSTAAPDWADALLAGRPYDDLDELLRRLRRARLGALDESQVDAALAGHPRIGEQAGSARVRGASGRSMPACREPTTRPDAMAGGNADYEERFGRIYLVAAAGRSAEELLGCSVRASTTTPPSSSTWYAASSPVSPGSASPTFSKRRRRRDALDPRARRRPRRPADGMRLRLERLDGAEPCRQHGHDRRRRPLPGPDRRTRARRRDLPPALRDRGVVRTRATPAFYPVVELVFEVTDADAHYHVPLLLSPFALLDLPGELTDGRPAGRDRGRHRRHDGRRPRARPRPRRRARRPDRGRRAGPAPPASPTTSSSGVDARGCLVTPGLVNTHHHLYQWVTRGLAVDDGLFGWLTTLYPVWGRIDEDITGPRPPRPGSAGWRAPGCTTTMDHHYVFPTRGGDLLGAEIEAARAIGLRFLADPRLDGPRPVAGRSAP